MQPEVLCSTLLDVATNIDRLWGRPTLVTAGSDAHAWRKRSPWALIEQLPSDRADRTVRLRWFPSKDNSGTDRHQALSLYYQGDRPSRLLLDSYSSKERRSYTIEFDLLEGTTTYRFSPQIDSLTSPRTAGHDALRQKDRILEFACGMLPAFYVGVMFVGQRHDN